MTNQQAASVRLAEAVVKLVAQDSLTAVLSRLTLGKLIIRNFEPLVAQVRDTVNILIPTMESNSTLGNASIVLTRYAEATFQIPDIAKVLAVPELLDFYLAPAAAALAEKIEKDLAAVASKLEANPKSDVVAEACKIAMVVRRMPPVLPGCGALSAYGESDDFGIRVVMSYNPRTLAQQFTIDILYGVGELAPKQQPTPIGSTWSALDHAKALHSILSRFRFADDPRPSNPANRVMKESLGLWIEEEERVCQH